MGRPKIEFTAIDAKRIAALARCHCPDHEIAAYMGVGEMTIKRHFGPLLKAQRDAGKCNLRRWQFAAAKKGNVTAMIWLGKQVLGQREPMPIEPPVYATDEEALIAAKDLVVKIEDKIKAKEAK